MSETAEEHKCVESRETAFQQICEGYLKDRNVGTFCHALCVTKEVILKDCPNVDGHDGKEYVFTAVWNHRKVVIKARSLTDAGLLSTTQRFDDHTLLQSLKDTFALTFYNSTKLKLESLVPWTISENGHLSDLNSTSLVNIWFLCQDNEYILSKVLGDSIQTKDHLIFPRVVATCGHFYAVEHANEILDHSYIDSSPNINDNLFYKRVKVSEMLITFLQTVEELEVKLELCDVKLDHFGVFNGQRTLKMLMIDSDMIYNHKIVTEVIGTIANCTVDSDCDFIDCQGKCLRDGYSSKCVPNEEDNNLTRICRNMLFMGSLETFGYKRDFGLMSSFPQKYRNTIKMINDECFSSTLKTNLKSKINKVLQLIKSLKET